MPKRLALLIGNVHYQDDRLLAPVLPETLNELSQLLLDPAIGRFDEVFLQLDRPALDIQLALAEFCDESQDEDDFLLIYFAGHALTAGQVLYLALPDTFTEDYLDATTIQAGYVKRRFGRARARHKLLLLDCLLEALPEGDDTQTEEATSGSPARALAEAFSGAGFAVISAANVPPIAPDESASTFTTALVTGLRTGQADTNDDQLVTVTEWVTFAQSQAAAGVTYFAADTLTEELIVASAPEHTGAVPAISPDPVAATAKTPWKWLVAILVLLFLFIGGALYAGGFFGDGTAVTDNPTATAPLITLAEIATQTPTATQTAAPTASQPPANTATASPTSTPTPSATAISDTATLTTAITATIGLSPTASLTATPTPTAPATDLMETATPVGTPLPLGVSIARQRIYLRTGPAINYRILAYLDQGTQVNILARSTEGDWFNVALADGRTGWLFSEMVEATDDLTPAQIPIAATIPVPLDEFFDFTAAPTDSGLTVSVSHVYVGTLGEGATFQAELMPPTDLVVPDYRGDIELGLGRFSVDFTRAASGNYASTGVRFCMLSAGGNEFYCETFPYFRQW